MVITGCGGGNGGEGGTTYSSSAYQVWVSGSSKVKGKAQQTGNILVLPRGVNAGSEYQPDAGAKVTIIKDDGTTVEITTDSNGVFDLVQSEDPNVKDIVNSAVIDINSQPDVLVTSSDGTKTTSTTIAVVVEDKDAQGVSLKIIPEQFKVRVDGMIGLAAIRLTPEGKIIKAKNVEWSASAGTVTAVSEDNTSLAVFNATGLSAGTKVTITATIQSGSSGADPVTATASGEVFDKARLLSISGIVYKDSTQNEVCANCMVNFDLPPAPGLKPFHFFGKANENGKYTVDVLPAPSNAPDSDGDGKGEVRYIIAVGSPDASKIVIGNMVSPDVSTSPEILVVEDASRTEVNIYATQKNYFPPKPPPLEGLIRDVWEEVRHNVHRHWWEPGTGIGKIVCLATNGTQGEEGDLLDDAYRTFKYWHYVITSKTDSSNWTIELTQQFMTPEGLKEGFKKLTITYDGTQFSFVKEIKPKPDPNTADFVKFVKVVEGTAMVNGADWSACSTDAVTSITVQTKLFFIESPDKVAILVDFEWTKVSDSEVNLKTTIKSPDKEVVLKESNITRTISGEPPNVTVSLNGNVTRYIKLPDGTEKTFSHSFQTMVVLNLSNGQGTFRLTNTTTGDPHEGAYIEISTQFPPPPPDPPKVAYGKVFDKDNNEIATFSIYMGGFVKMKMIGNPDDSNDDTEGGFQC